MFDMPDLVVAEHSNESWAPSLRASFFASSVLIISFSSSSEFSAETGFSTRKSILLPIFIIQMVWTSCSKMTWKNIMFPITDKKQLVCFGSILFYDRLPLLGHILKAFGRVDRIKYNYNVRLWEYFVTILFKIVFTRHIPDGQFILLNNYEFVSTCL